MADEIMHTASAVELRRKAEERVASQPAFTGEMDAKRLLHELQVHQIELEMQNEELRSALAEKSEYEAHLRYVISHTPAGYFHLDLDGRFLDVNDAWLRMHGYESKEEIIGKHFSITQVECASDSALKHMSELQRGLPIPFGEFKSRRKDNTVGHHIFSAHPVVHSEKIVGFEWFIIDISARIQAEAKLRESEEKYRNLFNNAEVGMFRARLDGLDILDRNQKFLDIVGKSQEDTFGKPLLIDWVDPKEREEMVRRVTADGHVSGYESRIMNKRSGVRIVLVSVVLYKEHGLLEGSILDITERKQIEEKLLLREQALADSEHFLNMIIATEPECINMLDINGNLLMMNPAGLEIIGADSFEQVKGKCIFPLITDSFRDDFIALTKQVFQGSAGNLEFETIGLKGRSVWLETHAVPFRNKQGEIISLLGITRDITERRQNQEQIRQLAFYDALTSLPNRRLLVDRLNQALAQAKRYKRSMALMFLDLDNFKQVNDTFGHDTGDELLKVVSVRLLDCVRGIDIVCRQGGDEFIVVLSEIAHPEDAAVVAHKIITSISEPVYLQEKEMRITASIGIAIYPVNGSDNYTELMKKADKAMYELKQNGRNGFAFYSELDSTDIA